MSLDPAIQKLLRAEGGIAPVKEDLSEFGVVPSLAEWTGHAQHFRESLSDAQCQRVHSHAHQLSELARL